MRLHTHAAIEGHGVRHRDGDSIAETWTVHRRHQPKHVDGVPRTKGLCLTTVCNPPHVRPGRCLLLAVPQRRDLHRHGARLRQCISDRRPVLLARGSICDDTVTQARAQFDWQPAPFGTILIDSGDPPPARLVRQWPGRCRRSPSSCCGPDGMPTAPQWREPLQALCVAAPYSPARHFSAVVSP